MKCPDKEERRNGEQRKSKIAIIKYVLLGEAIFNSRSLGFKINNLFDSNTNKCSYVPSRVILSPMKYMIRTLQLSELKEFTFYGRK